MAEWEERAERLHRRAAEIRQETAERQAREADRQAAATPGYVQRLEAAERAIEDVKAGVRSAFAAADREPPASAEKVRPDLKVIDGGLAS